MKVQYFIVHYAARKILNGWVMHLKKETKHHFIVINVTVSSELYAKLSHITQSKNKEGSTPAVKPSFVVMCFVYWFQIARSSKRTLHLPFL